MVKVLVRAFEDPNTGSRILLQELLGRPLCLRHDEAGRPVLEAGPFVSLSHTAGAAAAAISDHAVGVDLERLRPVRPGVAERVLSRQELEWYAGRGRRTEDFLTLWTLKESFYKYLGTGLPGFPNETRFQCRDEVWSLDGSALQFQTVQKDLLFLAVCAEEQEAEITF